MAETVRRAEEAIRLRKSTLHVAMNVAKLVNLRRDADLRADVLGSDIISVDGVGVAWGARLRGIRVPERVAGIDLMQELLQLCNDDGYRPYLFGARPEVLDAAVARIRSRYPKLEFAGYRNGYFMPEEESEIADEIRRSGADCLIVGISSPIKERFNRRYARSLDVPFVMGVGGAIDVMAGHVKRAPIWVQRVGMEWLYRVFQEPRRMWKRYLVSNTRYAGLMLAELWRR